MKINIDNDWKEIIENERAKEYFKKLEGTVDAEYEQHTVFPAKEDIFNAFRRTPLSQVKTVILGQDPYCRPGQAHGLSFSVLPGVDKPKSLNNIFKELQSDLGIPAPESGCLDSWAKQGVLLLNTVLTVRCGERNSHAGIGWEVFTDHIINILNSQDRPIAFLLWGNPAKEKAVMTTNPHHLILKASHPSPLSARRGFFGCRHFSKANEFLQNNNIDPINWDLNHRNTE